MNTISCLIQAHSAADERRDLLERRLRQSHADRLGGAATDVIWMVIEPGRMFTGAAPSTSSVIACTMDGPTTLEQRETYMRAICDLWTEITGCTDHEIVVSITETNGDS